MPTVIICAHLSRCGEISLFFNRILFNAFHVNESYWIGLNDINVDNDWRWITRHFHNGGFKATNETVFWKPGQPDNRANDCGYTFYHDYYATHLGYRYNITSLMMYAAGCRFLKASLCEKPVDL